MQDRPDHVLDRVGAVAGVAFIVLFVGIVALGSALPAPEHSMTEIERVAHARQDGILLGAYLGMLLTGALLVFGAVLAARQWRAEGSQGGWWLVALAGLAGTAVGLVTDMTVITFVRAVEDGVSGDALWVGYPPGPDGFLIAVPLAVFLLGIGLGARTSGAVPGWLGWFGLVLAVLFVAGAGGVTGDRVDGGPLGAVLVLGYLGLLVWVAASSVVLWRSPAAGEDRSSGSSDIALQTLPAGATSSPSSSGGWQTSIPADS
jgi:hypothetical protein